VSTGAKAEYFACSTSLSMHQRYSAAGQKSSTYSVTAS